MTVPSRIALRGGAWSTRPCRDLVQWHDVLFPPDAPASGCSAPALLERRAHHDPVALAVGAGALALARDGFMDGHTPFWYGSFALSVHR